MARPEIKLADTLHFDTLKEDRGSYFVEYRPPISGYPFATLQLIFPQEVSLPHIAGLMESELIAWLRRYDVPIMVSSFGSTGDLISLDGVRPYSHLIGWQESAGSVNSHWRLVSDEEFPRASWESSALRTIYRDIPFRTSANLLNTARAQRRVVRFGWWLVFVWVVAIPAGFAIFEFNGPEWLAWLMLGYALTAAYVKALKLLGWWPKTETDRAREAEELSMRHHHYHCERNPRAFERLKRENFERDARSDIAREAAALKEGEQWER